MAPTRCRVLGHAGTWTDLDARCVRTRTCRRCGDVATEQEHGWTGFSYVTDTGCEQRRKCERCGTTESRLLHSWGPWQYTGPDSSLLELRQTHGCARCGAEEQRDFERAF